MKGGGASSSSSMSQQDSTFEGPERGITLYEEPKLEGTSIQYYKLGKLKDGVEVGITSLSRSIEVSRVMKINIVSFSNIEDIAAQFWTLRSRHKKQQSKAVELPVCQARQSENVDLSWLLNDPAFWDKKKRRLWIVDLWECVNSSEKGTSGLFDTYLPVKHKKWRETVVYGSDWHDIVKRSEGDKIRYREQNGGSEVDVDIDFHELTRFYRHSIEHYDRTTWNKELVQVNRRPEQG
ncbi:hypothetical protein RHMOL_Rhmol09G0031500 [Rhododendron molle]|uniref:Uncharacterized protein n=1 Tax=Rhododendron molle TaxID=49168 RepID=A0ACC0MAF5_RHOML|nr:hypothetical protein RHMOL_Rhmol09G0031500 [Rhododendron molle]